MTSASKSDLYRGRVVATHDSFVVMGVDDYGLTIFEAFNSDDFDVDEEVEGTLRSQGVQYIRAVRTQKLVRGCVEIVRRLGDGTTFLSHNR